MCECGGGVNAGGGSDGGGPLLSSTLDGRYASPEAALESIAQLPAFWVVAIVVIGGAWAFSWIRKAKKPE
jgi:hypothetical protein